MSNNPLNIRSYGWLANNLSWAYVMESILNSFHSMGHNTFVVSTNGMNENSFEDKNIMVGSALALQKFGPGKKAIDIDITYTIPKNLPSRFLFNSKYKCVLYNFETTVWLDEWKKYYGCADLWFPSSNFSAEVFLMNGVPNNKVFVIPHGVDTEVFNKNIPKIKLKTQKKVKFVSVTAPHARKNIYGLLDCYCSAFSKKDDVVLVLKTKIYKKEDGKWGTNNQNGKKDFEVYVSDIIRDIYKKYGSNMPEIELITAHLDNVSSVYNACDINITATGSEGFYLPGLESMCCGNVNIVPNYSGQIDFMNGKNSLLVDTKLRYAKPEEQYWCYYPKSLIGNIVKEDMCEKMIYAYKNLDKLKEDFKNGMEQSVKEFSWNNAVDLIIKATRGEMEPYKKGTFDFKNYKRI